LLQKRRRRMHCFEPGEKSPQRGKGKKKEPSAIVGEKKRLTVTSKRGGKNLKVLHSEVFTAKRRARQESAGTEEKKRSRKSCKKIVRSTWGKLGTRIGLRGLCSDFFTKGKKLRGRSRDKKRKLSHSEALENRQRAREAQRRKGPPGCQKKKGKTVASH